MKYQTVIDFWFKKTTPKQWYAKDATFDKRVYKHFYALHQQVRKGEMANWRKAPKGRLAEIIVLDQFSRNMFRGKPESFASDSQALSLAQEAVRTGADKKLPKRERQFIYMPYMHSESKAIHTEAMKLFGALGGPDDQKYEILHKKIIDQFGRYPHRNKILGRTSTKAELKFIKNNSGF